MQQRQQRCCTKVLSFLRGNRIAILLFCGDSFSIKFSFNQIKKKKMSQSHLISMNSFSCHANPWYFGSPYPMSWTHLESNFITSIHVFYEKNVMLRVDCNELWSAQFLGPPTLHMFKSFQIVYDLKCAHFFVLIFLLLSHISLNIHMFIS